MKGLLRKPQILIVVLSLLAVGCAGSNNGDNGVGIRRSTTLTGGLNDNEVPYTTGGDKRPYQDYVEEENRKATETPAPKPQAPQETPRLNGGGSPSEAPKALELKSRLREFELIRYDESNKRDATRFGDGSFRLSIMFKQEKTVEFRGRFKGSKPKLLIEDKRSHYEISGELNDKTDGSDGLFVLTDRDTQETAKIYYRAMKRKLTVLEDRTETIATGSKFHQQLMFLKTNTFEWRHNWVVDGGVSTYVHDIVKKTWMGDSTIESAMVNILTLSGESLQTGNEEFPDVPVVVSSNKSPEALQVESGNLDANNPDTGAQLVTVTVKDTENPANTNGHKIAFQFEGDPVEAEEADTPPAQPTEPGPQTPVETEPQVPADPKPQEPAPQKPAAPSGREFVGIDSSNSLHKLMHEQILANDGSAGIVRWKQRFRPGGAERGDAQAFFRMANPVRALVNAISKAYDMAPIYFYLTYAESRFFKETSDAKKYKSVWTGDTSSRAFGPFQFQPATGEEQKLSVTAWSRDADTTNDERRYFVPAACAAARYIGTMVADFKSSDSSFAVLGYHEGKGGANKLIARAKDNAARFGIRYSVMAPGLSTDLQDYVDKVLALYVINQDPTSTKNAFDLGNEPFPSRNMFPPSKISSEKCRTATAAFK